MHAPEDGLRGGEFSEGGEDGEGGGRRRSGGGGRLWGGRGWLGEVGGLERGGGGGRRGGGERRRGRRGGKGAGTVHSFLSASVEVGRFDMDKNYPCRQDLWAQIQSTTCAEHRHGAIALPASQSQSSATSNCSHSASAFVDLHHTPPRDSTLYGVLKSESLTFQVTVEQRPSALSWGCFFTTTETSHLLNPSRTSGHCDCFKSSCRRHSAINN